MVQKTLILIVDDSYTIRHLIETVLTNNGFIAVSADSAELTRERFKQYGAFGFPVLTDPGNKVAQKYAMFEPAKGKMPEDLQHGTFVIGRDGLVHWTQYGYEPFTGNRTLLHEVAQLDNRLPKLK